MTRRKISWALISVSDKTGLVPFAQSLVDLGIELLSTGGTGQALKHAGLPVQEVANYTGQAEILDGRVKTLHPKIFAGLLADLNQESHSQTLADNAIKPLGLLVVNLYPFEQVTQQNTTTLAQAIEHIDIGGSALIRASAKNHANVTVVVNPDDYATVAEELRTHAGCVSDATKYQLACTAFSHSANYDAQVSHWLQTHNPHAPSNEEKAWPEHVQLSYKRTQILRYGENPHQSAAFYRAKRHTQSSFADFEQLQGLDLSYNNLADGDAAWSAVNAFEQNCCVIVKHGNPCGIARGDDVVAAYQKALQTDPVSAFGGIIAFNRVVEQRLAELLSKQFCEVVIATGFSPEALQVFSHKPKVRLLKLDPPTPANAWHLRQIDGGLLAQTPDLGDQEAFKLVAGRAPDETLRADIKFAWRAVRFIKSNAIVFCRHGQTLGIGAGQMSRVDSVRIACQKAEDAGLDLHDAVVASDAFFPFADSVEVLAATGARTIVQPGGSIRDKEVIAAAEQQQITMLFTGVRHFRH